MKKLHNSVSYKPLFIVLSLLLVLSGLSRHAFALPAQFQDQLVVSDLNFPTSMTQLPGGRMLVTEKSGQIWIFDPSVANPVKTAYMKITDIDTVGERGLLDIVLDPDFANNNFIYVSYQRESERRIFISRFTHQGNTADLATEFVVWKAPELFPDTHKFHHGGGLSFGPDGHLYLTTGYRNDTFDAQDLTTTAGKIIRVAKDGAIPADNPFVDGAGGNLDEIWAYGLRNPWRARWDLQGVGSSGPRLYFGEVGPNNNNTSFEDVHIGRKGANYGYPVCDGNNCNTSHDLYDPNQVYDPPLFTYSHGGGEAAVMGGIVYHGSQFPAAFQNVYFFGDYPTQRLRYLTFDNAGVVINDNDFQESAGLLVDIKEGNDGALYYIQIASDFDNFAANTGALRRIRFNGGNQAPQITSASADVVASATAPLTVNFTSVASDAESDALTYTWIFGDGEQATGANVSHTYTQKGSYEAVLQVSDATNTTTLEPPITINVGAKPEVTITAPVNGSLFRAGQPINYAANASDADGALTEDSYKWSVKFAHNDHIHPIVGPVSGSSGSFAAPDNGHSYFDRSGLLITVEVTDADGQVTTKSVRIDPEEVDITFNSQPSGISLILDDEALVTPAVYDASIDFNSSVTAPATACINNIEYSFSSWSNGAARSFIYKVPNQNTTLTAIYTAGGSCDSGGGPIPPPSSEVCGQSVDLEINDWINIPDITLSNDFTVEAWVKLETDIDGQDSIFGQEGPGPDINFFDAKLRIFSASDRIVANTAIVLDTWTHVAITRSGTSMKLYMNGVEDAAGDWDGALVLKAIGRGNQGFLAGQLDEVRVWNVARGPGQIILNHKKSVVANSPGLVGYWTFNESGQVVADSSSAGNNGSLGLDASAGNDDPKRIASTAPVVDDCATSASCTLDTDGNASVDALTDGLLFIRHMFGSRGDSLIDSAMGVGCTRCTAAEIETYMDQCAASGTSDIDGNGEIDALTDGLLDIRYLFGSRGEALITDAVGAGCTRCTAVEVEGYLQGLSP
ncbi:MAG: PQQ-dependent sugar dehydrogenase [Methylococcales bacterium]